MKLEKKYLNEILFKDDFYRVDKKIDSHEKEICSDIKIRNSQGIEVFLHYKQYASDLFASFNNGKVAVNIDFLAEPYRDKMKKSYNQIYLKCLEENKKTN